jgi:hypothetical protein
VRSSVHNETGFEKRFENLFLRLLGNANAVIAKCSIGIACVCAISSLGNAAGGGPDVAREIAPVLSPGRSYSEYIVIGFLGGFVAHDEAHHPEVRMIQALRQDYPDGVYFDLLENKKIDEAYDIIVNRLDADHDGRLSDDERHRACIELFGHSWGASAVVSLSRKLERKGVPVRLTVQVDSVAKPFHNDSIIPSNVQQAANFYQTQGLIHGESKIVAADPSRTTILGNFRRDYDREPEPCRGFSWHARFFTKAHIEIECDPTVWAQVENLLRDQLPPAPANSVRSAGADLPFAPNAPAVEKQ